MRFYSSAFAVFFNLACLKLAVGFLDPFFLCVFCFCTFVQNVKIPNMNHVRKNPIYSTGKCWHFACCHIDDLMCQMCSEYRRGGNTGVDAVVGVLATPGLQFTIYVCISRIPPPTGCNSQWIYYIPSLPAHGHWPLSSRDRHPPPYIHEQEPSTQNTAQVLVTSQWRESVHI